MLQKLKSLVFDEGGQGMTEYILLVTVFTAAALGVNKLFYVVLKGFFGKICLFRTGLFGMWP
jgi:Flp pilus assembly pilin Flp